LQILYLDSADLSGIDNMALNDDYFDVLEALNRLRKNKAGLLAAFRRLMQRADELEEENEKLRATKQQGGAE
jgi:hypothetical protein